MAHGTRNSYYIKGLSNYVFYLFCFLQVFPMICFVVLFGLFRKRQFSRMVMTWLWRSFHYPTVNAITVFMIHGNAFLCWPLTLLILSWFHWLFFKKLCFFSIFVMAIYAGKATTIKLTSKYLAFMLIPNNANCYGSRFFSKK